MAETSDQPSVLVPIDLSTDEEPDPQLLEFLGAARVVLGGWYPVPDQTAPEQIRDAHEEEAIERIEAIAAGFQDADTVIETVVVFTRDRETTVDRLADEFDCGVILVDRPVRRLERILVPIRSDVNLAAILDVVGALLNESEVSVTLLHVTPGEENTEAGAVLLRGATDELVEKGVDADRIDTVNLESDTPVEAIIDATANHDVLVIGESEPSLIQQIIGDVPGQLINGTDRPVLVVRKVSAQADGEA